MTNPSSPTILVVEDDPDLADLSTRSEEDHTVFTASSGEGALDP